MKTLGLAILAAGLLAGSTGAMAAKRENVTIRISTAGVDFANPESVAAFRRTVDRQIAAVCNPGERTDADTRPDFKCRNEMSANAEPTVTRLAMRATEHRMAGTD